MRRPLSSCVPAQPYGSAARIRLLLVLSLASAPACVQRPATVPEPRSRAAAVELAMRTVLDNALREGAFPGAVAVVGRHDGVMATVSLGKLDPQEQGAPDLHTVWDLASLTKVIATTTAVLQLSERGALALDDRVQQHLPTFRGEGKYEVTIRQLLTHSAGLPAWRNVFRETERSDSALVMVLEAPLEYRPGSRMVYSDVGAITLGELVRAVSGCALDAYVAEYITTPLGMTDTRFLPPPGWLARTAPTEIDPWRGRHVRGEVHDENAARLGGVAGHAGLFGTAHDLARFSRAMLRGGELDGVRILDAVTVASLSRPQNATLSHRSLGWETPTGANSAGGRLSSRAFGHTGFTGTSLWIDPGNDLFILLLTNRVNPTRQNVRIIAVRRALADAVIAALEGAAPVTSTATTIDQ